MMCQPSCWIGRGGMESIFLYLFQQFNSMTSSFTNLNICVEYKIGTACWNGTEFLNRTTAACIRSDTEYSRAQCMWNVHRAEALTAAGGCIILLLTKGEHGGGGRACNNARFVTDC